MVTHIFVTKPQVFVFGHFNVTADVLPHVFRLEGRFQTTYLVRGVEMFRYNGAVLMGSICIRTVCLVAYLMMLYHVRKLLLLARG
jgi:hypothetical protein